jgi:hypothetical protein
MVAISTVLDSFETLTNWSLFTAGDASIVNGRAIFATAAGDHGIGGPGAGGTYTVDVLTFEWVPDPANTARTYNFYIEEQVNGNGVSLQKTGTTLSFDRYTGVGSTNVASVTYSAANHRFMMIEVTGGNWIVSASPNGRPGTYVAVSGFSVSTTTVGWDGQGLGLNSGTYVSGTGTGAAYEFDNYNIDTPQYKATGVAQNPAAGAAAAVAWPTHSVDDVALLLVESCGGEAVTLSSAQGFTALPDSPSATGTTTNGTRVSAWWHRATSTSMTGPTVADPGDHWHGVILTFNMVTGTGNPYDDTNAAVKATASTSMTMPEVITTVADSLVVQIAARDNDSAAAAGSAYTNANLGNLQERYDAGTTIGNGGGLIVITGDKASVGATGTTSATVTSSINAYLSLNLAPGIALSTAALPQAAVTVTANSLSRLGQYNLGTTSVPVTASPLGSTRTLNQASLAIAANALSRLGAYNLGTASVGITANNLSRLGQYNLGTATVGLTAYGLTVGTSASTASLGIASIGLTANALSGSRNLGTATLTALANALTTSANRSLGTALLAITGLDLNSVELGAEPFGQTRTLPQASVGITASPLTYGGQGLLPQGSVAIAANLLASTRQTGTATIALTANQLALAAQLASASVGISAFSFSEALNLIAATVGINANNLNNLSPVPTANVGTVANNFSSGRQLSQASIAVLAQNLALTGSFNLGTANVGISAFGLLNQTTGNAFLQPASVSVNAGNLAVSLSAGLSASVGVSAAALARAAALSSPSVATTAANLSQLRSATLGLASVVATAYNLSTLSAGSAPLGTANVAITAFALSNTLLLSTGLASVSIAALPITYVDSPVSSVASVGTVATKLASTRQTVAALIDITAYGLGSSRPATLGTASVSLTAYSLSTEVGTTRGQTSTRPGMVGIKTAGGVLGTRTPSAIVAISTKPGG